MSVLDRPIGVFDSGIGGLTVFKALGRRMPGENLVYFGDTAHVPYGSKSKEAVSRYSVAVAKFLAGRRIKALVVACNTSSALALDAVRRALKGIPVLGVIEPGARAAAAATRNGVVGVIGTEATIKSRAYTESLRKLRPGLKVEAVACPLFVPLVEEGWWRHPVALSVAKEYLKTMRRSRADTLVLGCTHYPLLKPVLRRVMGSSARLIDSAEQTALETEELLESAGLRRRGRQGRREFFCSDAPARFHGLARRLLGLPVSRVGLHPFDI